MEGGHLYKPSGREVERTARARREPGGQQLMSPTESCCMGQLAVSGEQWSPVKLQGGRLSPRAGRPGGKADPCVN